MHHHHDPGNWLDFLGLLLYIILMGNTPAPQLEAQLQPNPAPADFDTTYQNLLRDLDIHNWKREAK